MSVFDNTYSSLADERLAQLVKDGDGDAFEMLAMRYLRNINFIARKYSAEGYEQNDFVQEGLLGLLYACKTYDETASASFKSYVDVIVKRRFISIVRKGNAKKAIPGSNIVQLQSLDESIEDNSGNPEELLLCRERLSQVMSNLKKHLSETEYNALNLYCAGLGYRQIAEKLSITEKSVDNALQRARKKILSHNMS